MDLIVMRHGVTELNTRHVLQGGGDTALSAWGERQAEEVGGMLHRLGLHFDTVYTSPLRRAVRTAEIVTGRPADSFHVDGRLREISFGPYEGRTFDSLEPEVQRFFFDPESGTPAGIEPVQHVVERTGAFLSELLASPPEGTVLVVMHGVSMRGLFAAAAGGEAVRPWEVPVANCEAFRYRPETRRFVSLVRPVENASQELKWEEEKEKKRV